MTLEEFYNTRQQFYIDNESLLVKFPTSKHANTSHAVWFTDISKPYLHSIRGYLWETENHEKDFIMVYWNNFEIPNITCLVLQYLFEYFPHIKWIGLGCQKGKEGEIWEPQLKVYKTESPK